MKLPSLDAIASLHTYCVSLFPTASLLGEFSHVDVEIHFPPFLLWIMGSATSCDGYCAYVRRLTWKAESLWLPSLRISPIFGPQRGAQVSCTKSQSNDMGKMDNLYLTTLQPCNWNDKAFSNGYYLLMGAIVNAKAPLSVSALQASYYDASLTLSANYSLSSLLIRLRPCNPYTSSPHSSPFAHDSHHPSAFNPNLTMFLNNFPIQLG